MPKVADVKLYWKKSASADIQRVQVVVTLDGSETTTDVGPEVEEFVLVLQASTSCQFKVTSYDSEGRFATSESYSFTLGDLEDPLPATDLGHTVLAVRDEGGGPAPQSAPQRSR